jgi:hypothetical protein
MKPLHSSREGASDVDNMSEFDSSKVIVLSELSAKEKEDFYNLILSNNVKLHYSNSQFIANVRLKGPKNEEEREEEIENEEEEVKITTGPIVPLVPIPTVNAVIKKTSKLTLQQRIQRLRLVESKKNKKSTRALSFQIAGVAAFDYHGFSRFCSLIGDDNSY